MRHPLFFLILVFASCHSKKKMRFAQPQFKLISPQASGVLFKNEVEDKRYDNALVHETFYFGGGVATVDINNDGLDDIFLTGNQVPDALYLNKGNLVFEDITQSAGILIDSTWSTGVTYVDINQDGWQDIYVCKSLYDDDPVKRKNILYVNQGNNTFKDESSKYGIDDVWRTQDAVFFDYDQDGDSDLLLINQPPNPGLLSPLKGKDYRLPELGIRFLENQNQFFVDRTKELGLSHSGYPLSASIGDLNNDGWVDLFIAHDYNSPDKIFLNMDGKSFIDATNTGLKQMSFFSMGTDLIDINNDLLDDIISVDMVSEDPYRNKANMGGMSPDAFDKVVKSGGNYQYMYNAVHLNRGLVQDQVPVFSNINFMSGMAKTDWSWSPVICDLNNDGLKDVFVSNGIKRDIRFTDALNTIQDTIYRLLVKGDVTQETIINSVDGRDFLDWMPSTPIANYVFENKDLLAWENSTKKWGLEKPSFSTGVAVSDLDNDGDLDIVINNVDDHPFVYQNMIIGRNYINVDLKCGNSNLNGVVVEAWSDDFVQRDAVRINRGFYSSSSRNIHFGLGEDSYLDSLIVYWSANEKSVLRNVKGNRTIVIDCTEEVENWNIDLGGATIASNMATELGLELSHKEDHFNDYKQQVLLPYKIGVNPRAIAVADVNGDGLDDLLVGSSIKDPFVIFKQQSNGSFSKMFESFLNKEVTDITVSDFDNDGDLDAYLSVGGSTYPANSKEYQNVFLINRNDDFVVQPDVFSLKNTSDSHALSTDLDNDGDLDILSFPLYVPGSYPLSDSVEVLINEDSKSDQILFDVDDASFRDLGLVRSSAKNDEGIFIVGSEWQNLKIASYKDSLSTISIDSSSGWWQSITACDYNKDGITDFIAGNLGLNHKYQVGDGSHFYIYHDDLDNNGSYDIVLSYEKKGAQYPVRGMSCSSEQMPVLTSEIESYDEFASLSLDEIYGNRIDGAKSNYADEFRSLLLTGNSDGSFSRRALPRFLQMFPIMDVIGLSDNRFLAVGNIKDMEIETPNIDAGYGVLFHISNDGHITELGSSAINLMGGQIRNIETIKIGSENHLVFFPLRGELTVIDSKCLL